MRQVRTLMLSSFIWSALVVPAFAMGNSSYVNYTQIGKPAADFTLDTIKEKSVNMTKYRDGKKAILFFWATWCPHCRVELKHLSEIQDDLKAKNIKLILVSLGEQKETVQEYILRHQYTWDVFLDENQTLEEPYRLIGVPTVYFLDEKGSITYIDHALPDNWDARFKTNE